MKATNRRRRRSFSAPIQNDLEYQETTHKPDSAELAADVQKLRDGDNSVKERIIKSHMRLAMSIVGEFATPNRSADLVGEAFLGLTQAVEWSGKHTDAEGTAHGSRLHDNNITPYIAATIRRFIRDFIEKDRIAYMPGRTFRAKAAAGEIDPNGNNSNPVLVSVVNIRLLVMSDDSDQFSFSVPEAKPEEPSIEFNEALTLAIHNEDERKVIELRKQGYGYVEIGNCLGLKKSRVGQINAMVEKRFDRLYVG